MNIDPIIDSLFTPDEIGVYLKIRSVQQSIGHSVEDYIVMNTGDNVDFVGRAKNRPKGVDFIVEGQDYSVKNAWNTENSSQKRDRGEMPHWYRLNKNRTTNWSNLFDGLVEHTCNEEEFREFAISRLPNSLEDFFG